MVGYYNRMNDDPSQQHEAVSGVQLEEGGWPAVKFYRESHSPKLVRLAIKYSGGLLKDEQQATVALFGLAALIFAASIFIFIRAL